MSSIEEFSELFRVSEIAEQAEDGECAACGDEDVKLIYHHLSYDPEITVEVCWSCHGQIHNGIGYPELEPLDGGHNPGKTVCIDEEYHEKLDEIQDKVWSTYSYKKIVHILIDKAYEDVVENE